MMTELNRKYYLPQQTKETIEGITGLRYPKGTMATYCDVWGAARDVEVVLYIEKMPGGPMYLIKGNNGIEEGLHFAEPKDIAFPEEGNDG